MVLVRRLVLCVVALAVLPVLGHAVAAETRALLVGVSRYDETIGIPSLRGPANDVRLFRDVLGRNGVTDIRIVADGVEGGQDPTRAAILAALAALADDSAPGDLVIVTMSGHGTRQPDADGDEGDGLDEVFLPADTGRAAPGDRAIPNAITDDELGAAVTAIRAKGADVWFVLDSCHSGSGLRAAGPDTADRFVEPSVLGLRAEAAAGVPDGAGNGAGALPAAPDVAGRLVAFYAARASEVAREVDLSGGAAGDAGWYGLFSSRLAARLETPGALTYRQLFQAVLSDMNAGSVPGGARLQTPSFEGDLVDAAVFGGTGTIGVRQFLLERDALAAGRVHGLTEGSLVALVGDAAAPQGAWLALAQVEEARATRSYLRRVDDGCTPEAGTLCPAAGPIPDGARFGRPLARPLDAVLRLSPPVSTASGTPVDPASPLATALSAAMAEVNAGAAARVETDAAGYAVEVAEHEGRLWFGLRASLGGHPAGLSWAPGDTVPLAALLVRIARAEELAAVLASVAGAGSALNPPPVEVTAELVTSRLADLDPPGAAGNPVRECTRALERARASGPGPLDPAAELKQCDMLGLAVRGALPGARDVNRIHIDAQFCVSVAHEHVEGDSRALPLGEAMVICSDCPGARYSAGEERLFVLITESADNAEQLDLTGLVETCDTAGGAPTRSAAAAEAASFLERLGRRPDTRGQFGGLTISDVWVTEYRWRVLPRAVAFQRGEAGDAAGGAIDSDQP